MPGDEEEPAIDYGALAEFRHQIRRFLRFSEQVAREAGLEPQHYQLLLALKGLPPGRRATVGELAGRLQLQHHSTVELIARLSERGLVCKQRDSRDQRQVIVMLTAHGEAVLRKLALHHRAELQIIGPALVHTLQSILTAASRPAGEGIPPEEIAAEEQ